MAKVPNGV